MLDISGHQIISLRSLGAFEKNVVIGVRTNPHTLSRSNPQALFTNCKQRTRYDVLRPLQPLTANDLFVLRINCRADA